MRPRRMFNSWFVVRGSWFVVRRLHSARITNDERRTTNDKNRGFTLIELIVVIAIITILSGFVMSAAQMARKRGSKAKAEAGLSMLETAISMYQLDMGTLPKSGNKELIAALSTGGAEPSVDWNGPYLKIKSAELSNGEFLDPWGNPWVYTVPGTHNTKSYDIYSKGPDGAGDGSGADDVNNW